MKRIYHPWHKWECYKSGFYSTSPPDGMTPEEAVQSYSKFLIDRVKFKKYLDRVITEWFFSCEHFLSNESMNRIAWLGQSSMCLATRVPSIYRSGFKLLSQEDQTIANGLAKIYLNKWLSFYENKNK